MGDLFSKMVNNSKLVIHNGSKTTEIECYFKQDTINTHTELEVTEIPKATSDQPVTEFHGSKPGLTTFEIRFDTDETREITSMGLYKKNNATDVTKITRQIQEAMKISEDIHRPPDVDFVYGSVKVTGIIVKADVKLESFTKDGMPVRATVSIELKEWSDKDKKTSLQSPDRTKSRIMTNDKSIWSMAQKEYGDEDYWRVIARANNIMDPFDVPIGIDIRIPAL